MLMRRFCGGCHTIWNSQSYQSALQTETEQTRKRPWHLLLGMIPCELRRGTGNELTGQGWKSCLNRWALGIFRKKHTLAVARREMHSSQSMFTSPWLPRLYGGNGVCSLKQNVSVLASSKLGGGFII